MKKDELVDLAMWLYKAASEHGADTGDDASTFEALGEVVDTARSQVLTMKPGTSVAIVKRVLLLSKFMTTADGQVSVIGLTRWVHCGMPSVVVGHKYAAALMVTTATDEAIELVRPPFPAFVLEVPEGLLELDLGRGEHDSIRRILVCQRPSSKTKEGWDWSYIAWSELGLSLYRFGVRAAELLPPDLGDEDIFPDGRRRHDAHDDPFELEMTDRDRRVSALVGRLIVNCCLAFSDPTMVKEVGSAHTEWRRRQSSGNCRHSSQPITRNYQLGKPVIHDFREAVKKYMRGERRSPSMQGMVAGHHKMQPYGPRSSLRKLIWREPFWRGPEDAPIAIRTHVMKPER
jgi:hypothetical protein